MSPWARPRMHRPEISHPGLARRECEAELLSALGYWPFPQVGLATVFSASLDVIAITETAERRLVNCSAVWMIARVPQIWARLRESPLPQSCRPRNDSPVAKPRQAQWSSMSEPQLVASEVGAAPSCYRWVRHR